jgi:ABC-type transporter Mla subunit MlaD
VSGDIYDERPESGMDTSQFGDQTLPPELIGTSLAEPVIDEVASTLSPLVERAAVACDSLRDAVARAGPTEATLRASLTQITELLERADRLVPELEAQKMGPAIAADTSAPNAADEVRAMIDTAVENLGTRCQMQLDLVRTEIDGLAKEMGARLDALTTRVEEIASRSIQAVPPTEHFNTDHGANGSAAVSEGAMAESLAVWETQVGELLRLFREKAEQAIARPKRSTPCASVPNGS